MEVSVITETGVRHPWNLNYFKSEFQPSIIELCKKNCFLGACFFMKLFLIVQDKCEYVVCKISVSALSSILF